MPGPIPKPESIRQRRNKVVTAAELVDSSPLKDGRIPPLPSRRDKLGHRIPWSREVRRWWRDVWTSPMAKEYTMADAHGLIDIAAMREQRIAKPSAALSAEIRIGEGRFGLDPTARRRLQWQIKRGEAPAASTAPVAQPPPAKDDPRTKLRAVK